MFNAFWFLDGEDATVIRRRAGRAAPALTAAAIALAALAAAGCGQEDAADEAARGAPSMTEEQYVAHIAALTIAVEEGLTGAAADARAVELGSSGHSREEVEEFAELLRERPERWLEMEREVDRRMADLRREAGKEGGAAGR